MADVNANIGIHIDSSAALAELKTLQRQIATFHASIAKNSAASAAAQKGLQQNLLNSINATGKFHAQMGLVRTSTESFTHALENNKLSMREYFRYAGASSKSFGKLFKSEFDTIGKVAEERVRKMQTQYIKMGRDASGAMKSMSVTPATLNMKDLGNQTAVAAQKQAIFNQLVKQGSTSLLNFGKNTQWAGRQLMVGFSVPLMYIGSIASKTFMDMEAQAIRFKRVYGDMFTTSGETDKALKDIENLAKSFTKYGVAVSKTMEMAASAAAMGKTGSDLTAQVAQATRLAILGGVEQEQALETTISLTNAFGVATEDLTQKINFLNAVENQTVVSIEDLTIAIPKAGPVVQQLGGDVEDLAFFLTAMKEGGINASEGANALKSGLASLINPTKKASEMLAGFGINIKAIVEGNAGNISETVIDFAQALNQLDPLSRARAIEQLFGKFQFARLSTLFQNVTKDGTQASRVLSLAGKSVEELAILSERELKTVEDAVGVNFKAAIEDLKVSIIPIGKAFLEALTPIVKFAAEILKKFDGLGDGTKKFIVVATTLVGILGPTLLMTFGLVANGAANIIKLFLALRTGFLKLTGNTTVLSQQTSYLNAEQLEAATVAASLNQAHTRLTQSFTLEASAVHALRNAYVQATTAALTFARANPGMMMPGFKGSDPKKFKQGATYVPGSGNKDTVPSMLTPGEAVIPKDVAQNPAYQPIIDAMVNGNLQGFEQGTTGVNFGGKEYNAKTARGATNIKKFLDDLIKNQDGTLTYIDPKTKETATFSEKRLREVFDYRSQPGKEFTAGDIMRSLNIGSGKRGTSAGTSAPAWVKKLVQESADKDKTIFAEKEFLKKTLKDKGITLTQAQERNVFGLDAAHIEKETTPDGKKVWKASNIVPEPGYINKYINDQVNNTKFGKELQALSDLELKKLGIDRIELNKLVTEGIHPTNSKSAATLAKIADYQKAKYPSNQTTYQAELASAGIKYRLENGTYGAGLKTLADRFPETKIASSNADQKIIFAETDADVKKSRFKNEPVTKYGRQIQPSSGYSFREANHLSGVFEKPDGSRVFVKPMMDEKAALAEQRATIIARDVHGLEAPEQKLRVIQDPKTGKKLFALESPYDSRFAESNFTGKFTKQEYFKQLVAANLRGDKDLHKGNLSGNVLADVGTAGVFEKASGKRDFATKMPSMAEQANINLLGVKGGAKKFFAEATIDIPKGMSADQYHNSMIKEIDEVLPKLKKTVAGFDLNPEERKIYQGMITRLEEGRKVDWRTFHKIHSGVAVAVQKKESIQDAKGKITKVTGQNTTALPKGVKPSTKRPDDSRMATLTPGSKVVTARPGKFRIIPGKADAPGLNQFGMPPIDQAEFRKQSDALKANAGALDENTVQTKKLTASKRALYGKINTGVNIFSGLTIAASFAGGSLGEIAQKLAPLGVMLSTLTMLVPSLKSGFLKLLPLLSNPFVLLAGAALALVVGFKVIQARNNKIATATSKYIDQISATTEKMKEVSKVTKTVGASEIMATRRENGTSEKYLTGFNRAGQQFGTSFLESEVGKTIFNTFKENLIKGGVNAAKTISLELSAYVSDGIMTAEDANSVARSIGISMSDMTISSDIQGYLRELLGPNGENLLKDPLKVRLNIGNEQLESSSQFLQILKDSSNMDIFKSKDLERASAVAASYTQTLEIIQAQRDAQANMYDEQIRVLEAQLKTTKDKQKQYEIELKIAALRGNQGTDDKELAKQKQQALRDQIAAFNYTESQGKFLRPNQQTAAFMKSGQEQVKTKWEGDPWVQKFLQRSAETGGKYTDELEVVINTIVGAGDLAPKSGIALLEMFGNKGNRARENELKTLLTTTLVLQDPGKVQELVNLTTGIKGDTDKKIGIDLFTKISAEGEEAKFDDRLNALKVLSALDGKEISLKAFLKGDALAKIDKLIPQLNKIEKQKTINKNILLGLNKTEGMPDLTELINTWEYYDNLPDDVKKTATQTFITIKKTIEDTGGYTSAQQEAESRGLKGVAAEAFIAKYGNNSGKLAASINQRLYESLPPPNTIPNIIGGGGGGGGNVTTRDTTLDELLKKLKFVRDASIDAEGSLSYLMKIVSGKGITKFAGVSQQLMSGLKGGLNREFISMLEGMDNKTRAIYMRVEKGRVILTNQGKALKVAFDEKVIGEFQDTQVRSVQDSVAQQAAFVKLKAAGVDTSTALEMVADANLAVAINAKKITSKEINELAKSAVAAKNPVSTLVIELEKAANAARQKMADVTNQIKILTEAKTKMGLSTEDLKIISEDPVLMQALEKLLNGDGTRKQLGDFENLIKSTINNIKGAKVKVEGDFTALTEGIEVSLQNSANKAQAIFDKLSADIQKGLDLRKASIEKDYRDQIKTAQIAVDEIQKTIDDGYDPATKLIIPGLQSKVDAAQKAINDSNDTYDTLVKTIEDKYLTQTLDNLGNIVSSGLLAKPQAEVDRLTKSIEDLQNKGGINAIGLTQFGAAAAGDFKGNNLTLAEAEKAIADVELFIEKTYSRPIEMLQQAIAGQQRTLEITYTREIEKIQKKIEDIQTKIAKEFEKPLSNIQEESTKLSEDLAVMDNAADAINKKYEIQENALTKIAEINQDIVEQQKQQLGLADALSKGDISAAAAAVQDIRATQAAKALGAQQGTLAKAKEAELAAIKSPSGLTRDQISERQYALERASYKIQQLQKVEQEKILALQEQIYTIENNPDRLKILEDIKLNEDKIYELDNLRILANNAIYTVQSQIITRNNEISAQQVLLTKAQTDLKDVEDKREAELKAAEIKHAAALVGLKDNLKLAEDNLKKANDALAIAQAALKTIEDSRAKAMEEVESDEQKFKDMVAAIDLATQSTVLFEDQLKAAKTAADNLKTALENVTKAKDAELNAEIKRQQDAAKAEADRIAAEKKAAEEKIAAAKAEIMAAEEALNNAIKNEESSTIVTRLKEKLDQARNAYALIMEANAKFTTPIPTTIEQQRSEARAKNPGMPTSLLNQIYPALAPFNKGGMVMPKYFAAGGFSKGTDTIPAMLTPGEFVIKKSAVDSYGVNNLSKINNGMSPDSSVYNYSLSVNVSGNNLNADDIASTVMQKIKYIDGQRVRGQR